MLWKKIQKGGLGFSFCQKKLNIACNLMLDQMKIQLIFDENFLNNYPA